MIKLVHYVEKWKLITIDNIKPYYWISTFGRVYSTCTNSFINPQYTHSGYLQVGLMTNDGGRIYRKVHRLVMLTFHYFPGCENYQVNHKDTCKTNNYEYNLEWCTPSENVHHAILNNCRSDFIGDHNPRSTITEQQAREIYSLIINTNYSIKEISNIIGCSPSTIKNIAKGATWIYLFNSDDVKSMQESLKRRSVSDEDKIKICQYYENHISDYSSKYGMVKDIIMKALCYNGLEINPYNTALAKRLYYKNQDPEITNLFNY